MAAARLQQFVRGGGLYLVAVLLAIGLGDSKWLMPVVYLGAFAAMVILGYLGWRAADARRQAKTMCLGCGYPREGLAAEAVCPECGLPCGQRPT